MNENVGRRKHSRRGLRSGNERWDQDETVHGWDWQCRESWIRAILYCIPSPKGLVRRRSQFDRGFKIAAPEPATLWLRRGFADADACRFLGNPHTPRDVHICAAASAGDAITLVSVRLPVWSVHPSFPHRPSSRGEELARSARAFSQGRPDSKRKGPSR